MKNQSLPFGQRRAGYFDITETMMTRATQPGESLLQALEGMDVVYRALCAVLYNFVPQSGHPGGSISSGRIVQSLLFHAMDYNFSNPDQQDADILSYAAGHKAMGLYAAWALRNELVRITHASLLPDERKQLRLEDLLGFRKNPVTGTPLFKQYQAKALDGHPAPSTPFVKLSTGASGVGVAATLGLAFGALDTYGAENAPRVHILEGEGGMTPGRVQEALATAGTARLRNLVMHLDWNQASIDSNRVCREGADPGDYVQWSPAEVLYLNDWNVISVPDGRDFRQILAAQQLALEGLNQQPTGIVYRTTKGWKYGIEGRSSHGAGHAFCSEGFYKALEEFESAFDIRFPRFAGEKTPETLEKSFFDCLLVIRSVLERNAAITRVLGDGIVEAGRRLAERKLQPRADLPKISVLYDERVSPEKTPQELRLAPGQSATLRGALGDAVGYLNRLTGGAFIVSSADLLESTSASAANKGFPAGFFNAVSNPGSRVLATGGICEDAMGGILAGISTFGTHVGIGSSYGAFIAPLQHMSARLHAIGQQMREHVSGDPQKPFLMVCAHAGPKTGEDGPTHADPQALQLLQENFPKGSMITLTPWDAQEVWPLLIAALKARPAVIAPFVTRPAEPVIDREKLRLPPATEAVKGVYALRRVDERRGKSAGTVVLQGNGVASIFLNEVLPVLEQERLDLNVFYVASAELFDLLPEEEQERIFPAACAQEAIGITEFTLPCLYRWVTSVEGRRRSLHPFKGGHFLGSGQGSQVFEEARLNGKSQLRAVMGYLARKVL